jgi:hypothetical protein
MEPINLFDLLKEVLTSWQVIVVTLVLLLYTHIVSYVSQKYHQPRSFKKINLFKKKKDQAQVAAVPEGPEEMISGGDSNDELGLEEA